MTNAFSPCGPDHADLAEGFALTTINHLFTTMRRGEKWEVQRGGISTDPIQFASSGWKEISGTVLVPARRCPYDVPEAAAEALVATGLNPGTARGVLNDLRRDGWDVVEQAKPIPETWTLVVSDWSGQRYTIVHSVLGTVGQVEPHASGKCGRMPCFKASTLSDRSIAFGTTLVEAADQFMADRFPHASFA